MIGDFPIQFSIYTNCHLHHVFLAWEACDSKDSPPSCSFSQPKELGPIHTGWKCQMEQEISGISKFPEKRTTSRGEPKFSKRISGKCLLHSILNRNFRKFWSNGTRPCFSVTCPRLDENDGTLLPTGQPIRVALAPGNSH